MEYKINITAKDNLVELAEAISGTNFRDKIKNKLIDNEADIEFYASQKEIRLDDLVVNDTVYSIVVNYRLGINADLTVGVVISFVKIDELGKNEPYELPL